MTTKGEPATEAQLERRRARDRLLRFLYRGGHMLREQLPDQTVAWRRASRSGHGFEDAMVQRLLKKGFVHEGQQYDLSYRSKTSTWKAIAIDTSE